jgi:hypothetical protein|tara:strand:+ start:276 stop:479 length:204 start_codon:yes stop_codon:yes gene_type:complete
MKLSLYDRLKTEHKEALASYYHNAPFTHKSIIKVLSNEYYFTDVRYGTAKDVELTCKISFFGDAFYE